jgi:hypothetical protein
MLRISEVIDNRFLSLRDPGSGAVAATRLI